MKRNKQKRFDLANFSATSAPLILLLIFASLLIFETIYGFDPDFNFRSMYDLYKAEAVGSYTFSTNGFESIILLIAAFILGIKQFRFTNKKELGYTTLLFAQKRKSIFNKNRKFSSKARKFTLPLPSALLPQKTATLERIAVFYYK